MTISGAFRELSLDSTTESDYQRQISLFPLNTFVIHIKLQPKHIVTGMFDYIEQSTGEESEIMILLLNNSCRSVIVRAQRLSDLERFLLHPYQHTLLQEALHFLPIAAHIKKHDTKRLNQVSSLIFNFTYVVSSSLNAQR
jgi:hypothetical protein